MFHQRFTYFRVIIQTTTTRYTMLSCPFTEIAVYHVFLILWDCLLLYSWIIRIVRRFYWVIVWWNWINSNWSIRCYLDWCIQMINTCCTSIVVIDCFIQISTTWWIQIIGDYIIWISCCCWFRFIFCYNDYSPTLCRMSFFSSSSFHQCYLVKWILEMTH